MTAPVEIKPGMWVVTASGRVILAHDETYARALKSVAVCVFSTEQAARTRADMARTAFDRALRGEGE